MRQSFGVAGWRAVCYICLLMNPDPKACDVVLMFCIAVAVVASGVQGMVVCFGAGDHSAFDKAHGEHFGGIDDVPGSAEHDVSPVAAGAAEDCCGDCIDVWLPPDIVSQFTRLVRQERVPRDTGARPSEDLHGINGRLGPVAVRTLLRRRGRTRLPAALLAQRTVVLRI